MTLRERIVIEAREWMGTPYQHQACLKGVGADCIGFVVGDLQHVGVISFDWWRGEGAAYAGYAPSAKRGPILAALRKHLIEIPFDQARPGDIVHLGFDDDLQHMAILADYRHGGMSIVHALSTAGRVTEHRLDASWRRAIVGAFVVPEKG